MTLGDDRREKPRRTSVGENLVWGGSRDAPVRPVRAPLRSGRVRRTRGTVARRGAGGRRGRGLGRPGRAGRGTGIARSRGAARIRRVKARPLEADAHGVEHFPQRIVLTGGTRHKRVLTETLVLLEAMIAVLAGIDIGGHGNLRGGHRRQSRSGTAGHRTADRAHAVAIQCTVATGQVTQRTAPSTARQP